MMKESGSRTLLVTGASCPVGRRVVELLLEARVGPIIAVTRRPKQVADLAALGAVVREADFDEPEPPARAFAGADRVLLLSGGTVVPPGRLLSRHRVAIEAASRAGVQHLTYTSIVNPDTASPVTSAGEHRATEALVADVFPHSTILRFNIFTDALLPDLREAVATGHLLSIKEGAGAAYVTQEDCACVAAYVLAGAALQPRTPRAASLLEPDSTRGMTLDVTGPASVTFSELARLANEETGRPVRHVPIHPDVLRMGLEVARSWYPTAQLKLSVEEGIARGQFASVSTTVADLTSRNPTSVAEFLARNRQQIMPGHGRIAT